MPAANCFRSTLFTFQSDAAVHEFLFHTTTAAAVAAVAAQRISFSKQFSIR